MKQYKSCLVQVSRSHDTNTANTPSQEIKVAQAALVYVCLLPDGDSGQTTMQVSSPMVPRSPGSLTSLSLRRNRGTGSWLVLLPMLCLHQKCFGEIVKAVGTWFSTSSVTPGAPLPISCRFPADRRDRVFVFGAGQHKETLGIERMAKCSCPFYSEQSRQKHTVAAHI